MCIYTHNARLDNITKKNMSNDELPMSHFNFKNLSLHNSISSFGDFIPLRMKMDASAFYNHINNYEFVRYNKRKNIPRYGLSLTSLNGGLDGVPDLDSLPEYNRENSTSYVEGDFRTFTEVWRKSREIQILVDGISQHIFRSHVLKFNPGGFFPIHRDFHKANFDHIRLICPIKNCNFPNNVFILDRNIIHNWEHGRLYFLNTVKEHLLFNSSTNDSYWAVFNVDLNEEVVEFIHRNFLAS